jgi:drug/metabolite transporter (DMT)-like permease
LPTCDVDVLTEHFGERIGFALMIIAVSSWAASFVWLKMALRTLPPGGIAAARFLLASAILVVISLPFGRVRSQLFSRRLWPTFLLVGFLGTFLPNILQNYGLTLIGAGISGVIQGTGPVYTALLATITLGESFGRRKAVGAIAAFGGTLLLSLGMGGGGRVSVAGIVLVALSALAYSLYTIALRKSLLEKVHPMVMLTGSMVTGTVPLLVFSFLVEPMDALLSPSVSEIKLIVALAIIPTLLAFACYVLALSRIEASKAAAFIFLVPVGTLFLGPLFLGESISPIQFGYCGLIIAGVALAESERKQGLETKPRINGVETLDKI